MSTDEPDREPEHPDDEHPELAELDDDHPMIKAIKAAAPRWEDLPDHVRERIRRLFPPAPPR